MFAISRPRKRGALHDSFTSVMLELVDDDGADDDAAFDDLLPISGNVGQIEHVIQHADNENPDDGAGNSTDTAGGNAMVSMAQLERERSQIL